MTSTAKVAAWRKANPERHRRHRLNYRHSSKNKAAQDRYVKSAKGRAASRRRTRAFMERLKARDPAEWHRRVKSQNLARYGLTLMEFSNMVLAQEGACAVCNCPMEKPHVDHDHETGVVRGLLCELCNRGIGHFKDDPRLLRAAAAYLERVS